jgi:hypothetical protein
VTGVPLESESFAIARRNSLRAPPIDRTAYALVGDVETAGNSFAASIAPTCIPWGRSPQRPATEPLNEGTSDSRYLAAKWMRT